MGNPGWIPFKPKFCKGAAVHRLFCKLARQLAKLTASAEQQDQNESVEVWRRFALSKGLKCPSQDRSRLGAAVNVLADLAKQGWRVGASSSSVRVFRPELVRDTEKEVDIRSEIRTSQLAERDAQLREAAT